MRFTLSRRLDWRRAAVRPGDRGEPCPACGKPVIDTSHGVRLHGALFHAGCVLYRRRVPRVQPEQV